MYADFLASLNGHSGYLMLGYGSLLSHASRKHYSNIDKPGLPVVLDGWQRSWTSRAEHESQTYVGAQPQPDKQLNGVIFALPELDEDFRSRERDYQFVRVDQTDLSLVLPASNEKTLRAALARFEILICKTLVPKHASEAYPVHQSYLDTCLLGCLEVANAEFAKGFLASTTGLKPNWLNDRADPKYPRTACVNPQQQSVIDGLLREAGLLSGRKSC